MVSTERFIVDQQDQQEEPLIHTHKSDSVAKRWIRRIVGYLIALACLVWIFYDVQAEQLWQNIKNINWWWVILGVFLDIISYFCQAVRWAFLLKPLGKVTWLRSTQAIYAGLFANEVLPIRFGELIRAYLVSRWLSTNFISVLPSIVVERLFDIVWMAIMAGLVIIFAPLPESIVRSMDIFGIIVLLAVVFFVYIIFHKRKRDSNQAVEKPTNFRIVKHIRSIIKRFTEGLRNISISRDFFLSFFISFLIPALQALSFWAIIVSYHIDIHIGLGMVVFLIVYLGTAIPNTPSNVGTYQFFCVLGLTFFGVEKTLATGFSIVVFILLTVPIWALGFLAISFSGATLYDLRYQVSKLITRKKIAEKS
jgi:uncharacterized protein (TIRG00374 family)